MKKALSTLLYAAVLAVACNAQTAVTIESNVNYDILARADVIKEIGLTDAQKSKVTCAVAAHTKAINDSIQDLVGEASGDIQEQINGIVKKQQANLHKQLAAILDEKQLKRFEQVELQLAGIDAFSREPIKKALSFTKEQSAMITKLTSEIEEAIQSMVENGTYKEIEGGGVALELRPEDEKKLEEMGRKAQTQLAATFTDEQKKKWEELTGPAFKPAKQ